MGRGLKAGGEAAAAATEPLLFQHSTHRQRRPAPVPTSAHLPPLFFKQGLRGSIPPNFPYLHVEFGIADGFVHVIDDEQKFDRSLARSVMIGARACCTARRWGPVGPPLQMGTRSMPKQASTMRALPLIYVQGYML